MSQSASPSAKPSSSKSAILDRIRKNKPKDSSSPLPNLDEAWITYPNREAHFAEVLKSVGGLCVPIDDRNQLRGTIANLACMSGAQKIVCNIDGLDVGNVALNSINDPHELATVDVAVIAGAFAVAENGAVWLTDQRIRHRAILFITQHLVLVVPRQSIVDNMHQAYAQLRFEDAGYGIFISGPSKTADIEQSLVIGAHGPRSLTVILSD